MDGRLKARVARAPEVIVARVDPGLSAWVGDLRPLVYDDGGSPVEDRPAHVRAASAVRRWGHRLVIVQDDVNVLAIRDDAGETTPVLLPIGPGGRRVFDDLVGNKKDKLDLEASAVLPDGRLVVFGSGSSPARERIVVLSEDLTPRIVEASALYAVLRADAGFAGSELNVEGALVKGDALLLVQRGNGARRGGVEPVDAIGELELGPFLGWLDHDHEMPHLSATVQVELGELGGSRLAFTDATLTADGQIAILVCAEASPDAVSDGPVAGCRFGLLDGRELRVTDVLDERGDRLLLKLEGIEHRPGAALQFDVVADMDRPAEPARLGRLFVRDAAC